MISHEYDKANENLGKERKREDCCRQNRSQDMAKISPGRKSALEDAIALLPQILIK